MSVFSKFLKKTFGIPEVKLLEVPFMNTLIVNTASGELLRALKQMDNTQFMLIYVALNNEKARRDALAAGK